LQIDSVVLASDHLHNDPVQAHSFATFAERGTEMAVLAESASRDRQWYIVGRWQEYEGEGRANLIRIVAIGIFYTVQLVHYYTFVDHNPDSPAFQQATVFHQAATTLAVAGSLASLAILLCLRRRVFPGSLKFVSSGVDILLVTCLASVGEGPKSPLVVIYFLIIAMAGLRFSLRLVWCTTIGSMLGYLALVGIKDDQWFDPHHFVEPVEQVMTLVSLALTGIIIGQVIRRVRALAEDYSHRTEATRTPL